MIAYIYRVDSREKDRAGDSRTALDRRGSSRLEADRPPDSGRRILPSGRSEDAAAEDAPRAASRLASTSLPGASHDRYSARGGAARDGKAESHARQSAPEGRGAAAVEREPAERIMPGRLTRSMDAVEEVERRKHEAAPSKTEGPTVGDNRADTHAARHAPVAGWAGPNNSRQEGSVADRDRGLDSRRRNAVQGETEKSGGRSKGTSEVDPVETRPWHMTREQRIKAERSAAMTQSRSSKQRRADPERIFSKGADRAIERHPEMERKAGRSADRVSHCPKLCEAPEQRGSKAGTLQRDSLAAVPSRPERSTRSEGQSDRHSSDARKEDPAPDRDRAEASHTAADRLSGRASRKELLSGSHLADSRTSQRADNMPIQSAKRVAEGSERMYPESSRERRPLEPSGVSKGKRHAPPVPAATSGQAAREEQEQRHTAPSQGERAAEQKQDTHDRDRIARSSREEKVVGARAPEMGVRHNDAPTHEKGGHAADRNPAAREGKKADAPSAYGNAEKAQPPEHDPQHAATGGANLFACFAASKHIHHPRTLTRSAHL